MPDDDFDTVSDLLFGAGERYHTVRATIEHRRRGSLATEAERRYTEYGFSHGILSNIDPPYHVPRYQTHEDLEETSQLWYEWPARWRQETESSGQPGTTYRVADGKGPWWFYGVLEGTYRVAHYSPLNLRGEFSPDKELACLLDPSRERNGFECTVRIVGEARLLGRKTVEIEAEAISWDYAPVRPFWDGADDYLMSIDAESGTIPRFASRLNKEEFEVFEMTDLTLDEAFPDGTFSLDLPGVEFEKIDPLE